MRLTRHHHRISWSASILNQRVAEVMSFGVVDSFVDAIGSWLARRRGWLPANSTVTLRLDDVGDSTLLNHTLTGRLVRVAHLQRHRTEAEVQLDSPFDYVSGVTFREITALLVAPRYRGQSFSRLMLASLVVNVAAAKIEDTDGQKRLHTIGIAVMKLAPKRCQR